MDTLPNNVARCFVVVLSCNVDRDSVLILVCVAYFLPPTTYCCKQIVHICCVMFLSFVRSFVRSSVLSFLRSSICVFVQHVLPPLHELAMSYPTAQYHDSFERLLILAIPWTHVWFLGFYWFFHLGLNFVGEVCYCVEVYNTAQLD